MDEVSILLCHWVFGSQCFETTKIWSSHKECWGTGGCLNTQEWCKQWWLHGNIMEARVHKRYQAAGGGGETGDDREYLPSLDRFKPVGQLHYSLYRINVAHPTTSSVVTKPLLPGALERATSIIKWGEVWEGRMDRLVGTKQLPAPKVKVAASQSACWN